MKKNQLAVMEIRDPDVSAIGGGLFGLAHVTETSQARIF